MADDIAQWLEGIGLGQYAQAFAENDIDFDILPDLNDAELEKLGVSLGDRKRLLRAIDSLSDSNRRFGCPTAATSLSLSMPKSCPASCWLRGERSGGSV